MKASAATLTDKAYGQLRSMLLRGDLVGGSMVSVQKLAEQLGVGHMPIRSAVRRLESEGFVKQIPRAGTIISRPSLRSLIELYELREWLEPPAAAKAARHATPQQIDRLVQICNEMLECLPRLKTDGGIATRQEYQKIQECDCRFHMEIMRIGGNERAMRIISDMQIFEKIWFNDAIAWPQIDRKLLVYSYYGGHRKLARRIEKGNPVTAAHALRDHIRSARRDAGKLYRRKLRHIDEDAVQA